MTPVTNANAAISASSATAPAPGWANMITPNAIESRPPSATSSDLPWLSTRTDARRICENGDRDCPGRDGVEQPQHRQVRPDEDDDADGDPEQSLDDEARAPPANRDAERFADRRDAGNERERTTSGRTSVCSRCFWHETRVVTTCKEFANARAASAPSHSPHAMLCERVGLARSR
jgi:hypothetical protein